MIAVFFVACAYACAHIYRFGAVQMTGFSININANCNQTNFNSNIIRESICVGVNYGCPHIDAKHKILYQKNRSIPYPNQPTSK